ncbi:ABC transporter permease [Sulfurovum riftiae]|uniref:ABC transporter n=1 Tax=Sulfurovum riftiae TaxID=1630136 RepID=A0A151CGS5_9BACT|nr:ABC transporter permease [Sulfurovum riftiae]KYJ86740.1 ABC transporter [Sulfurovum riftiae]
MRAGVIKAYILKELTELFRTRLIIMVYLMPSMILLLFGYGIRMEVTHARIVILDNDQSHYSQLLTSKFEDSKYFDPMVMQISEKEALHLIKQAKAEMILIIPSSFEKRLIHGQKTEIGLFIDAAFPTRATTMESYVQGVILQAASEVGQKRSQNALITINSRNLFNQAMRDENAMVPGLIGLVLLVAPAILSALLIVKEKERGTIFNFYASPIRKHEFILAKLTPVFLLHSVNIFILFLWATWLFEVPFRGSFALYWVSSELYILISLGIGMLISIVTRSQIAAVVITVIVTLLPGFLYSGIILPISAMDHESYIEAHMFPVMYYNHILYDAFLIGEGLDSPTNRLYLGILVLYGATLLLLGTLFLKKELK